MTVPAIYQIPLIIAMEFMGPNMRVFANMVLCVAWVLGTVLLGGIAFFFRSWRTLTLIASVPFALLLGYWWYLPESVRWLLAKDRLGEAENIIQRVAKWNKAKIPKNYLEIHMEEAKKFTESDEKPEPKATTIDLLRTPNMRKKILIVTAVWVANAVVYSALTYLSAVLGTDNPYLSFTISGLVEMPGYILAWLAVDPFGRKWPLVISMIITAVCLLLTYFATEIYWLLLTLNMISKCAISMAYAILYLYGVELFPTVVRGQAFGLVSLMVSISLLSVPYIVYLGQYSTILPLLILGGLSLICGTATVVLPETAYSSLPTTLEEGEAFGKDDKWFSCDVRKRRRLQHQKIVRNRASRRETIRKRSMHGDQAHSNLEPLTIAQDD